MPKTPTISFVSLGWIFFRANSAMQARQMLSAVLSPSSYSARLLSGSLYLLVLALAGGYAVVLLIADGLSRHEAADVGGAADVGTAPDRTPNRFAAIVSYTRWYWIPPLYVLLLLIVLIVTRSQSESAAQFMYRQF